MLTEMEASVAFTITNRWSVHGRTGTLETVRTSAHAFLGCDSRLADRQPLKDVMNQPHS